MSEELRTAEKKQRRKRYSFGRPEQIAAQESLREKLKEAGLDSLKSPKSLPEEGEALISQAKEEGLLPPVVPRQVEDVAAETSVLSDTIVADRPMMFAHSRTKRVNVEQLVKLAVIGCTNAEIGVYFGLDASTVSRRFAGSLQKGRELRKRLLRQRQTEVALAGNVGMLIWLGKNVLGQRDKPLESSGTNDGPLTIAFFDAILEEKQRRGL